MTDYHFAETQGAPGAPLVFTFHGTGGSERQFHDLPRQILPEAHVVSPRGDVSEGGALRFFRRTGEGVYDMPDLADRTARMGAFLRSAVSRIGARRVIGLGYSNGANILASVAMDRPDLFTDLILLHPLIPWTPEPVPALRNVRVLITAGQRDPICPAPQTQALADWFAKQGARVDLTWHPGGHEIAQAEVVALQQALAG
ncbi:alpha/beta hydrolase [Thalassococcus sp. CAU 1522]|uniref:Alpha/beta hydrolase n=1 Tax=Thalassococcus arenae TaxID=2851652 RepID=A0ABS6N4T2_9RHOB|nr:alpha/beta hydrolase [Thalassococcus arenae]